MKYITSIIYANKSWDIRTYFIELNNTYKTMFTEPYSIKHETELYANTVRNNDKTYVCTYVPCLNSKLVELMPQPISIVES